jgi:hypothetical protein
VESSESKPPNPASRSSSAIRRSHKLLGLKERRIGLQTAEEVVQIVVEFDFTIETMLLLVDISTNLKILEVVMSTLN